MKWQVLLEAGLRAPSSKNKHTTQFILVEDRETLDRLSRMRESGALFLQQVPLGIVVLGSPMECECWIADASLAAGYIQLQAEALGLGSCWADAYGCYTGAGQESAESCAMSSISPISSRCFVSSPSGIRRAKLRPAPRRR